MRAPSRKEQRALVNLENVGQAEVNREHWWHMLSIIDRERAMGVAGLTRAHARLPLAAFSDAERERVRLAVAIHVSRMEVVARCMAAHNTTVYGLLH